jgi:hypothetical protein
MVEEDSYFRKSMPQGHFLRGCPQPFLSKSHPIYFLINPPPTPPFNIPLDPPSKGEIKNLTKMENTQTKLVISL